MKNIFKLIILPILLTACISTGGGGNGYNPDYGTTSPERPPTDGGGDTGTGDDGNNGSTEDPDIEIPDPPHITTSLSTIKTSVNNEVQIIKFVEIAYGPIDINDYEEIVKEPPPLGITDAQKEYDIAQALISYYTGLLLKTKEELTTLSTEDENLVNELKTALTLIGEKDIADSSTEASVLIEAITNTSNNITTIVNNFKADTVLKTDYLQDLDLMGDTFATDLTYSVDENGVINGIQYGTEKLDTIFVESDGTLLITKNLKENETTNKFKYTYNGTDYFGSSVSDLKANMLAAGISASVTTSIPSSDIYVNTNFYTFKSVGASVKLTYSDFGIFMTQDGYISLDSDLSDTDIYTNHYYYATGYEQKIANTPTTNMTFTGKAIGTLEYEKNTYQKDTISGLTSNRYTTSEEKNITGDVSLNVNISGNTTNENFTINFDDWYTLTFTQTNGANPSNTQYKNDSDYSGGDNYNLNGYSTSSNTIDKNYYGDTEDAPIEVTGKGDIHFEDNTFYTFKQDVEIPPTEEGGTPTTEERLFEQYIYEDVNLEYWFGATKN